LKQGAQAFKGIGIIEALRLLDIAVLGDALLLIVSVYTLTAGNKHWNAPYEVIPTFVTGYVQEQIFESHKRLFLCYQLSLPIGAFD